MHPRRILMFLTIFSGFLTQFVFPQEVIPEGAASLAFVFDITGSMYDDLVQVIDGAAKILATTLARREKPLYNYVLVPFHDPEIGPVVVTTDPDDFQHELRNLYVQGGGDCPEMSIGAIKKALDVSLPNSFIYVFTDARSKDFDLTEDVLAMIQTKQSQVVFVLTGDCDDPTHPGYKAYEQIASTSSGQVFLLKKSQVNELLVFVREAVQARKVNLMSIDVSGADTQTFQIPIDTKLKEMTVSVSGLDPQITLRDPSGNRVTKENGLKTLLDINNAMIVNVKDPLPGQWVMKVTSNAPHTIRVTGLSTTDFAVGFSRKPLQDMKEIYHRPIGGIPTFTSINSTNLPKPGGFSRLELVDLKGVTLMEFPLVRDPDRAETYNLSSFTPPGQFFYVKVSGIDDKGFVIQRLTPTAISPQVPLPPEVHMPAVTHGYYSTTAVVTCLIQSMVPYTVRWFRQEVQRGTEQYFGDSGTAILEIPQASQFSEGIYTCNASNVAGSRAVQTFLDISEPPPEIIVPSNVSVLPGNNAILHCQVFSTVVYNLTWYTRGYIRPLRSSSKYEVFNNDSLLVRKVDAEDEGAYICVAANEGGKTQDQIWILLQVVPTVVTTPGEVKFVAGESVSVECSAVGFPAPILFWTRGGQALIADEHVIIRDGVLTIHNVQRSDEGTYVCVARNPAGESRATAVLKYMEVPKVYEYESRVLVASGDEAVLNCKADGIPKPEIKWFKGDLELKTVSYVQVNNGQMKILGAQELDAGEYQCVAINDAGSDSATIKLEVGSEPVIIQAPNNLGVDIDGNATILCRAVGLPTPKIFWQREDGKRLDFTGRVKQLPSGSLFIEGVRVGDEGRYTCSAQNQFGIKEASAFLTVTGIVRPLIGYMEPTVSVIQGNDLELNCQVILGNPRPKVQWVRRDMILQQDQHVVKNLDGNIVISNVQPRHEGEYMCFASNVGGNATFVVSVDVQVPPSYQFTRPEDEETNFSIIEGQGVVLPCAVVGDPQPFIEWFKDESPISPTDYHYFIREDGSLEIFSAEATDTGRYRCSASNVAGNLEKVVELFVQVPPTIAGDPSQELTVIENTTVTLTCEVTGVPRPVIQWKKNFVPFKPESKRHVISDIGLTITEAKIMDKAIYECIASNLAGNETKVISLVVKIPPTILDKGETDITVLKGQEVTLTCENTGDPIPVVEWKKDETPMNIFDTENGFNLLPTGSLQITAVKVKDTGKYVCIVTNSAGVDTRDFSLKVHDPPSLPSDLVKKTDIIEQNSLILQCPAVGVPKPRITWYKDDIRLSSNEVGIVMLEDGSLQIQDVKAKNSGKYKCVAENVAGSTEHEVDVKVLVPPKLIGVDPSKATGIDNPKVVVKETATLTCPVESDPPPQITWLKNGKEINFDDPESRITVSKDGKILTIARTEVDDTARYTCIAENVAGEVEKNFDLDVQVPPKIDEESATKSNVSIIVGNPLYLDCPVSGIPRPKILWYKNGEVISPDLDPNIRVYAEGRRLEIVNVRVSDTGNYKCVAENVVGKADRGFGVDVHVPPSIDKPGEVDKQEVVTGGSVTITCPAAGIPVPNITWFKNNEPIQENSTKYLLLNQGWTLEIRSASVNDTSRYTCRASNVAGENEKTFDISVLVPPKFKLEEVDLFPKVIVNKTTVINCPVDGIPQPEITWYKNNVLLDGSIKKRYEILSGGRQLRITGAQLADTAKYTCQALNKAGENKLSVELEVLVPARIDIQSTNTNPKVVVNGSVTVLCPAVGVPPPVIVWYKDGVEITEDSNIRILKGGQELVIVNAEVEDTGQYKCQATNEAGQSEIGYKVDVQVPPSIPTVDIDTAPHVIVNDDVILSCPASGIPKPSIIWLKDGQPINFVTERHLTVSAEGQRLHIKGAQVDDAAVYTCVAANEAGSTEQTYDLDVWVPPEIDETNLEKQPKVVKGHTTVLYCPVVGNPVPDILWLKNGEPVQLDNRVQIQSNGIQLKIQNATVNDTGQYTCTARNSAGYDAVDYNLDVYVPPSIDESNVVYLRKVIQNQTLLMECAVSGIPPPKVRWLIKGEPLQLTPRMRLFDSNRQLEIESAQVLDTAIYTCIAENDAGELRKKFDVEVYVPPSINVSKVLTELTVIQNRTVFIECPVSGIPFPSIMWLKDKLPLLDFPYKDLRVHDKDQRLEVSNAQVDDAGTYTCRATNPAGQADQKYVLEVYVPPDIVGSQKVDIVTVVAGKPVTLNCTATGIPQPLLTWSKDKKIIVLSENPKIRILSGGQSLQITSAEVSHTGKYICYAENQAGITEKGFDLQVQVLPTIPGSARVQNKWVVSNQPLTLECLAEGIPTPQIKWVRRGEEIRQFGNPSIRIVDNGRRLLLASSQLVDQGDYSCIATNAAGNATLEYIVAVYVPPTIEDGPTEVSAKIQTGATLHCESLALPDPKIEWTKNGEPFPTTGLRHRMLVSGTIEFTSVRIEDSGNYTCTATNEAGKASRNIRLNVQVPPRIVGEKFRHVKAVVGNGVYLLCDATGIPEPRIIWQKGTSLITGSEDIDILENGTLFLKKTTTKDEGFFVCMAQNNAGTDFGQFSLTIQVPPSINIRQRSFIVQQSRFIVLPCQANGRPRPQISWEKDGEPIKRTDFHYRLLRTLELAIPFARAEDAGIYKCIAENEAGRDQVDLELIVQVPPEIEKESRLLTFSVEETASIPCNAKGNPTPVISWTKDGQSLRDVPGKFHIDQRGTLIIYNLQEDDTGSYVCTAVNVAGKDSQERLLRIQVPPQFLTAPTNQEVLVNDRLELSCFANGVPTPNIRWMRNNQIIPSQPSVNGRSVYIIRNIRPEDGGLYTCIAENPAGIINTTASVIVKVPPEIIAFPGNKAVTVAEKVILTCSVGGDPAPEIIWTKNGREIRYSERIQLLANGSLVIFNSTSTDAGEYKCVATNDAGTSEGTATLTIREPPKFRIEPESTRVDEGTTAILNCVAEGEPKPEMFWMIGWEKLGSDGRLTILPNNSIRIAAAQLSDSKTYRCLASNSLGKTFVEANITVVVHGSWSEWSSFGKCSLTCGQGLQQRTRSCENPEPTNGGRSCIGESVEQRPCSVRQCPVEGQWGNWLPWEECSTTCGPGQRVRNRRCDNPAPQLGGQSCIGLSTEMTVCNIRPCPVNGSWGAWLPWQPCSQTCGEGHQERIRRCDSPRPEHGGQECDGVGVEKRTCNLKECAVDGNWGGWGEWARCSLSCGGGIRSRLRNCNNPGPQHGGLFCLGTDTQIDYCNSESCPIHGNWSPWGDWGECSASCNGGLRKRFRTCSNPPPSNNGRSCIGPGEDSEPCNPLACPVDGRWGPWSDWSTCSKSCDTGTQQRSRICSQPISGGRVCLGDATQVKRCSLGPCHKIPRVAEGNLVGYINNIDIPASTFRADAVPLPDSSATRVNATIRNVPRDVVPHFRNLISVLNPVYWTTATEVDGAFNGFSLTKGEFTREVQVEFTTGEILKMSHYSKGVDANGVLQLDIVVRGVVPDIATTQQVQVLPYSEQYVQAKDGLIHARSSRMFSVDGFMLPYAWNHTITYSTHETMPYLVQELTAQRLDIDVNPDGEIVKYALDASIAPGNPSNACPVGYSLDTTGPFCTDDDECSQNLCSHYCHNSPGSFACSCPVGYMLSMDGRNCLDIDECSTRSANCRSDQECVNTIGSYRCVINCRPGYKRSEDGTRCQDINECKETPEVCDQHCINRIGGFRCRCNQGYKKVGKGKCVDIDECEQNPCAQVCANMASSYVCSCRQGYALVSGGLCRDVNECAEGGADCGQNQECVNEVGTYRCIDACPDGYQRSSDGECIDVDECATGQNRCYYNQQCINLEGGYQCLCPRGYRSSGPGTPCLDINECEEHKDVCAHKCRNTPGGFECVCPPGQVLLFDRKSCAGLEFLEPSRVISTNEVNFSPRLRNPRSLSDSFLHINYMSTSNGQKWCPQGFQYNSKIHSCIDIDECVEDPGVCQHNCTNTIGSYQCQCPPGYSLSQDGQKCQDIDECIEFSIDCGPEKMCFNTRGEFTCIDTPCPTNYQRDPITNYCVLECIDAEVACPPGGKYADVIEFRTLALPSGILAHQDLLRLIAYNQNNVILRKTEFKILENEEGIPFRIRLEDGIGVLYTLQPLEDQHVYRIKVRARSFDNLEKTIQYQTTFIIHISISAYPY